MIKRIAALLIAAVMTFGFCSCGKTETKEIPETTTATVTENAASTADIDLSSMNFNMVNAQITEIKNTPDSYLGKNVRIKGIYQTSHYDETDKDYHYIVGSDPTACCSWNMEFVLPGSLQYPQTGTNIELFGTFDEYEELGVKYYYLNVSTIDTL